MKIPDGWGAYISFLYDIKATQSIARSARAQKSSVASTAVVSCARGNFLRALVHMPWLRDNLSLDIC
ncbi:MULTISPECIES: hypothetical protein [unclassified Microcoleus]|uniref:hypothetical protein n=1 Tax=unclassified Microcoleus TaxID=2642155 RepID=UPI0025EEB43C|nr:MULTISPECIES: hypothetical protein [unclassified Microcoleus]